MKKEWFTAGELAALLLPEVPGNRTAFIRYVANNGWQHPDRQWSESSPRGVWRRRQGRGGGIEFHYALLPARARAEVVRRFSTPDAPPPDGARKKAKARLESGEAWARFERLDDGAKDKAKYRLEVITEVDDMVIGGTGKELALRLVCDRLAIATRTYYDWEGRIHGVERADWLPYLADHYVGRTSTAEMSPEAWEYFKAEYLTLSRQPLGTAYTKTVETGAERGWIIPSDKTFKRRLQREVPAEVIVLKREGEEAAARMYPAQRRDRSSLHALEAVNWDGHKFDVFCRWPGADKPARPIISVFQDLYSGKILSWRIDRSENTAAFRLAFGDMAERYGYPDHITIDNTLTAANKEMTGGTPNRFRFKVKPDEQHGLFTILGIKVHWTQPYHGQSKPIERAFGDLCNHISKASDCVCAYTGNSPTAKPENYGSRAIPIADFIAHVEREIRLHNARPKRESKVCGGVLSFDQAFEQSYEQAPIRKARPEHKFLWLLSSTHVRGLEDIAEILEAPPLPRALRAKPAMDTDCRQSRRRAS